MNTKPLVHLSRSTTWDQSQEAEGGTESGRAKGLGRGIVWDGPCGLTGSALPSAPLGQWLTPLLGLISGPVCIPVNQRTVLTQGAWPPGLFSPQGAMWGAMPPTDPFVLQKLTQKSQLWWQGDRPGLAVLWWASPSPASSRCLCDDRFALREITQFLSDHSFFDPQICFRRLRVECAERR